MKSSMHILESQQFSREQIEILFKRAHALEKHAKRTLKKKIMATLFYEPSTRTRFSFESAMHRLGGSVISTENAKEFSSAAKGETLEDTIRVVGHYADVIVLRHYEAGAATRAAQVSLVPVINAGDGAGQHPTQALLDVYTIARERGSVDGARVALVGDLKNGRAVRSLLYMLTKFKGVSCTLIAPDALRMNEELSAYAASHGVTLTETSNLEEGIKDADVVYMTRVQKERFSDPASYEALKGNYILTHAHADSLKPSAIIMHPLPRVDEIHPDVDVSPHARYFEQAKHGVALRMALLEHVLV